MCLNKSSNQASKMNNTALNNLISELKHLDPNATVFDELINALLAILYTHKIEQKQNAINCAYCDRKQLSDCVSGWMPRAYTVNTDKTEYTYAVRCANFTAAYNLRPRYEPPKKR